MIDSPATSEYFSDSDSDSSISIKGRQALMKEFDDLLNSIRSLDGTFLQGPSESELQGLAEFGPIVIFNISDIRSDVFLITADKIRLLHLPWLTLNSVREITKRFLTAIAEQRYTSRYNHARLEMNAILEWLWDSIAKPVLDAIGFTHRPLDGEPWPRVWWVGSVLLTLLPIHAAGHHNLTSESALDRVVSSYAPSVKSLSYARERAGKTETTSRDNAILVTMPTTPEKGDLPSAEREVKELTNLFAIAGIDVKVRQNPTRRKSSLSYPSIRSSTLRVMRVLRRAIHLKVVFFLKTGKQNF